MRLPAVQRLLGIGKTTVNKLCNAGHLDRQHMGGGRGDDGEHRGFRRTAEEGLRGGFITRPSFYLVEMIRLSLHHLFSQLHLLAALIPPQHFR